MAAQAELLRQGGAEVTLPAGGAISNDAVFAEAIGRNSVTLGIAISNETAAPLPPPKGGFAFGGADPKTYLPAYTGGVGNIPEIIGPAHGLGSFSFPTAVDGVVRTVPLVFHAQGNLYPSLGLEALRVAQGAGSYVIRSTGASGEADTGRAAMVALRDGALDVPTGAAGDFWIYYSGIPSMPTVPAIEVLSGDMAALQQAVGGRIVLIGTSAVGLRDIVSVPMGYSTAGVRVHAEIIDQVVGQVFLTRPDWAPGAEVAAAAVLGLVLLAFAGRTGALITSGVALVLIAAAAGASWVGFRGPAAAARSAAARPRGGARLPRHHAHRAAAERPRAPVRARRLRPLSVADAGRAARRQPAGAGARRRTARSDRAVLRYPRLHLDVGKDEPDRADRAAQRLPHAHDRHPPGERGDHRQVHGRRHHVLLERPARYRRARAQGPPRRARHGALAR